MNQQQKHMENLDMICRLCRKIIKLDSGYRNKKETISCKNEINELFTCKIESEDQTIYPRFLCSNCRRKLMRYKENRCVALPIKIANFQPHNDNDCEVCQSSLTPYLFRIESSGIIKSTNIQVEILTVDEIASIALKYHFQKFDNNEDLVLVKTIRDLISFNFRLKVFSDFSWNIFIAEKCVVKEVNPDLSVLPVHLTKQNVVSFFDELEKMKICPANDDFDDIIKHKISFGSNFVFLDKSKTVKAQIENKYLSSIADMNTIRSTACLKLIQQFDSRCVNCATLRKDLIVTSHRHEKSTTVVKDRTPNIYRSREDLLSKCEEQVKKIKNLKSMLQNKEKKIQKLFKAESMVIPQELHSEMSKVLNQTEPGFTKDTPKYLLWKEQLKYSQLEKKSGMRWHPLMLRFCLSIYLKSPAAYDHLARSGFIELPHRTTLNKYTGFASSGAGFVQEILQKLCDDVKVDTLQDYERQVVIVFDEIKIKKDLVFCPSSGQIRGFTELGDINAELDHFDKQFNTNSTTSHHKDLASHIICFMVNGLFKRFSYPLGYFCTTGITSDQLYPLVWKAIGVAETCELEVCAVICDGASPNRRFFKLHKLIDSTNVSNEGVVYWTPNRFDLNRKIYFFSDPPHLVKTLRNTIENSGGHNNTRNLTRNGKIISWLQIVELYKNDLGVDRAAPGIRKLHKLTHDHIYLTPRLRMRVNLAAQVLSKSVADALAHRNVEHTAELEKFIRLCDTFFDVLNVQNTFQGQKLRKDSLHPYRSATDWRFDWLKNVFLKYINDWKCEADASTGLTNDMKARLCLTIQTIEGLRLTVHSFVEMVPMLLTKFVDKNLYFLSDKLNQDTVEEHFGRIRMRGGANENPTAKDYGLLNRKVIVVKSDLLKVMRGNTRGRIRDDVTLTIDEGEKLPKRAKKL